MPTGERAARAGKQKEIDEQGDKERRGEGEAKCRKRGGDCRRLESDGGHVMGFKLAAWPHATDVADFH